MQKTSAAVLFQRLLTAGGPLAGDDQEQTPVGSVTGPLATPLHNRRKIELLAMDFVFAVAGCWLMFSKLRSAGAGFCIGLSSALQVTVFLVYTFFSTSHMFLQQRAGKTGYNIIAATLLIYFFKFVISFFLFLCKGNVREGLSSLFHPGCSSRKWGKLWGFILPLIPGGLFAGYDALSFLSLQNVDPPTYQVFVRMRIVLVGLLWQVLFARRLSGPQWLAFLLILVAGLNKGVDITSMKNAHFGMYGICIIMAMNGMSAFANVSSEVLLKEMPMPIDLVNACTYLWGIVCLVVVLLCTEGSGALYSEVLSTAAWAKLWADPYMMSSIVCLSAFGIITAYFLKQLSNVLKEIAGGVVIVVSAIIHGLMEPSSLSTLAVVGTTMAVLGIGVYTTSPLVKPGSDS